MDYELENNNNVVNYSAPHALTHSNNSGDRQCFLSPRVYEDQEVESFEHSVQLVVEFESRCSGSRVSVLNHLFQRGLREGEGWVGRMARRT